MFDFIYYKREYYYKETLIFTATSISDLKYNSLKYNEVFLKNCRYVKDLKELSDTDLLNNMVIKELPKPTTFPKFSNEKPFKLFWNKSFIYNPQIIGIRWNGYEWEYKIKNIGHEYDYHSEKKLEQIL